MGLAIQIEGKAGMNVAEEPRRTLGAAVGNGITVLGGRTIRIGLAGLRRNRAGHLLAFTAFRVAALTRITNDVFTYTVAKRLDAHVADTAIGVVHTLGRVALVEHLVAIVALRTIRVGDAIVPGTADPLDAFLFALTIGRNRTSDIAPVAAVVACTGVWSAASVAVAAHQQEGRPQNKGHPQKHRQTSRYHFLEV
jgi:hypothetical protein